MMSRTELGRPTKIDKNTVKKLESVLKRGASVSEACDYAGISRQVFYYNLKNSPDFFYKIDKAKNHLKYLAITNISKAMEKGDIKVSKWWLEKTNYFNYITTIPNDENPENKPVTYKEALELIQNTVDL